MNGIPILSRFLAHFASRAVPRPDLHTAWQHPAQLPDFVRTSQVAQRTLALLGPLDWAALPERDLQRNWGQTPVPYRAFIAAYLVKLQEGLFSMGSLHAFLTVHPELLWLLGFPLAVSKAAPLGFDPQASLPTARHLTRMLRQMPNSLGQCVLGDSIRLLRETLAAQGCATGACVALDTKHILAFVKENNPKAYVSNRFDKTQQPDGDPDCKLGCKRRHNRRKPGTDPEIAQKESVGEFYWGYGSGIVVTQVPGWGEFVLAELTQPFDHPDLSYFFPLMKQVEQRLGQKPRWGAFDAAFDAFYVYEYFANPDDLAGFAAIPFAEKGGYKAGQRHFDPQGRPLCQAGLAMPVKFTFTDRTRALIEHQRARHVCPLLHPTPNGQPCPIAHKRWAKGGCLADLPTSVGARLRYTLDRDSDAYKAIYKQRTAAERLNSQAVALGIERPHLRNQAAITNQNTLIYTLINLRLLQRICLHLIPPA